MIYVVLLPKTPGAHFMATVDDTGKIELTPGW
jgi:hypothetical protein